MNVPMYKSLGCLLCSALLLASGCATVLKSKTTAVSMQAPQGTEVFVDGQAKGSAPTTVELSNNENHLVTFKADGKESTCQIGTKIGVSWVVLNILFTGGLGLIIDAATANWKNLDRTNCTASL